MPRHLRRRVETLIPVGLRLLDESGRHRIAEPMLGIAVEVSGYDLQVSVMGRSGRPLSFGLAAQQKVVVSFLATELHEKVESLACDLDSVVPVPGQSDAWRVRLLLPTLMPELAEEIVSALQRYGRSPRRQVPIRTAILLAGGAALAAWMVTAWQAQASIEAQKKRGDQLSADLAFSARTVNQLSGFLEEADRELETLRNTLDQAISAQAALMELRAEHDALNERLEQAVQMSDAASRVLLRGVSLTDFRTVRSIRGEAAAPRLVYRNGTLELISPGPEQSRIARNAAALLEAYAKLRSIPLRRFGDGSLESAEGDIGVETEQAFVVGEGEKARPDFVFETRNPMTGSWLAAYAEIGVPEVWSWTKGRLEVRRLEEGTYAIASRSQVLPALDTDRLAWFVAQDGSPVEFAQSLGESLP